MLVLVLILILILSFCFGPDGNGSARGHGKARGGTAGVILALSRDFFHAIVGDGNDRRDGRAPILLFYLASLSHE